MHEDPGIIIRELHSTGEYEACVEFQRETWGRDFNDVVPLSILKVGQYVGGVTAGAFDGTGRMLGFVFGLTGVREGRLVHWSDMLAVRPDLRDLNLGWRLKAYQRETLLPLGVESVYWTYDPLEARNAHLNLNKLGAEVAEYTVNMYGDSTSELHQGLGTDRFIVDWRIQSARVSRILDGVREPISERFAAAPVINPPDGHGLPVDGPLVEAGAVRVEIPARIQEAKRAHPDAGRRWRESTRRAFTHYLALGYRVSTIYRDGGDRCYYGIEKT